MYSAYVYFKDLSYVKKFVNTVSKYSKLVVNLVTDVYTIDAHSLMGIISLDIEKPVLLEVPSDDIPEGFFKDIEPYLYTAEAQAAAN